MTSGSDAASETQKSGGKGLAIAALVIGIIALPGCCMAGFYLNYVLAILAIIFGAMSMKGPGSGMAKAGLTLGIIGIITSTVVLLSGDKLKEWAEEMQKEQQVEGAGNNNDYNNGGNDNGNFDSGSNDGNVDG